MPKKKHERLVKQFTLRMRNDLYDRIEEAAHALGLDATSLIRMMCAMTLPEFERRAEEATKGVRRPSEQEKPVGT